MTTERERRIHAFGKRVVALAEELPEEQGHKVAVLFHDIFTQVVKDTKNSDEYLKLVKGCCLEGLTRLVDHIEEHEGKEALEKLAPFVTEMCEKAQLEYVRMEKKCNE